jgi:hypothetical protein
MQGAQTAEVGMFSPKSMNSGKKLNLALRQSKSRESLKRSSRASSIDDEERKDPIPAH